MVIKKIISIALSSLFLVGFFWIAPSVSANSSQEIAIQEVGPKTESFSLRHPFAVPLRVTDNFFPSENGVVTISVIQYVEGTYPPTPNSTFILYDRELNGTWGPISLKHIVGSSGTVQFNVVEGREYYIVVLNENWRDVLNISGSISYPSTYQ